MGDLILLLYLADIVSFIKPTAIIISIILACISIVLYSAENVEFVVTRRWVCTWSVICMLIGAATPSKETLQMVAALQAGKTATELIASSDLGKKAYSVLDSYLDEALANKKIKEQNNQRR